MGDSVSDEDEEESELEELDELDDDDVDELDGILALCFWWCLDFFLVFGSRDWDFGVTDGSTLPELDRLASAWGVEWPWPAFPIPEDPEEVAIGCPVAEESNASSRGAVQVGWSPVSSAASSSGLLLSPTGAWARDWPGLESAVSISSVSCKRLRCRLRAFQNFSLSLLLSCSSDSSRLTPVLHSTGFPSNFSILLRCLDFSACWLTSASVAERKSQGIQRKGGGSAWIFATWEAIPLVSFPVAQLAPVGPPSRIAFPHGGQQTRPETTEPV